MRILRGYFGDVYLVVFSFDGKVIVSGGVDKMIKLWDVDRGELVNIFEGYFWVVLFVVISLDD